MKTCVQRLAGLPAFTLLALSFCALTGCEEGPFNSDQARAILVSQQIPLTGEQVQISDDQMTCGEQHDLWTVSRDPDGTGKARLTKAARDLKFNDDVILDATNPPHVQVSGNFRLVVPAIEESKDVDANTKTIIAKAGVVIDHLCFRDQPVPLLGVHRGQFTLTATPAFKFVSKDGGWTVDGLLH